MMFKNKKGDLIANIFIVVLGLIIFFALYPAMKSLLDIGISFTTDMQGAFLIAAIPFVILLGALVWAYRTTVGGE